MPQAKELKHWATSVGFQNATDDDVKTLLDDMKRMDFIDSWETSKD